VQDILNALIDGLPGFPEAITVVFPQAQIHTCARRAGRRPGSGPPPCRIVAVLFGDRFVPET
jgi:hypothetical protein